MSEMPSYGTVRKNARGGAAFSNGTEFEAWQSGWCERPGAACSRDTIQRGTGNLACPLLDVALLEEKTPAEWGERKPALGPEMYECSKYSTD